jgi:curved DNA-binding protein
MHGEDRHARVSVDLRDSYHGARRSMTLRVPEMTEDGRILLKDKTLNVKIPKGIREGQKIRLAGQGGPGLGEGKAGDLFLEVEFSPDDVYRVDGIDVYMSLPVTPWEAALGASVTAPTPSGKLVLKVPAGSNQGSKLRLKGKGIPAKAPGDLYVVLDVRLPPAEGEEAKAVYEKMSKEMPFDPRANL